ncbi:MAG: hypothetical protein JW908_13480 [Anaerolineales bacterium]|nr:hypothetical protein [Anaerolineales bacterium]
MESLEHTRFITLNYPNLQGLRTIPLGLLLMGLTIWANRQHGPASDLTLPITATLVCLAIYVFISQYYDRTYGKVKRIITHSELLISASGAILALTAFILDTRNVIEVSLLGLVFALAFVFTGFWYWRPVKLLLSINVIIALVLAVFSIFPLTGEQEWWRLIGCKSSLLAFTFLYGLSCLICGVIAHVYFVRSLPKTQESL